MNQGQIINDLTAQIDGILVDYSQRYLNELEYYPGCCGGDWTEDEIQMLSHYKNTLKQYLYQSRSPLNTCIKEPLLKKLIGNAQSLAGKAGCSVGESVTVDKSNLSTWIINNPTCVPYEEWERGVYSTCDISYDARIVFDSLQDCVIDFDLVQALPLIEDLKKQCNVTFRATSIDLDVCQLEFQTLITNYPDCSISFQSYQEIARCGISYDTVQELAKCNVYIDYNYTSKCPELVFSSTRFPVCEIEDLPITIS